jgi:parvulin-like peptidyl-prolyl isomerase
MLTAGAACLVAGAVFWMRSGSARATARPGADADGGVAATIPSPEDASDYSHRVVAYIYDSIPITRRDLGEYLIERYGVDHVEKMIRQYLIESVAVRAGVTVTPVEIEAEVKEAMSLAKVDRQQFAQIISSRLGCSISEWKEDIVRSRLLVSKIVRDSVSVTEEELRLGFESTCGDKIQARVIMWPQADHEEAVKQLALMRNNEQEFDRYSRQQKDESLAAKGGEIELFHNFAKNPQTEAAAFALKEGEVSNLIATADGWMVIKCIKHVPGQTGINFDDVREGMQREAITRKTNAAVSAFLAELKNKAHPKILLKKAAPTRGASEGLPSTEPVAIVYDNTPVTRAQLGEWLINRMGDKEIEKLVTLRIVDHAAAEKHVDVTDAEIEAEVTTTLESMHMSLEQLEKTVLKPHGISLVSWRRDPISHLKLAKLCRDRVKVTDEDIKNAYDAYYGEKIQARIIIWPTKEQHIAMAMYPKIRDDEAAFDRAARTQANPSLSARGGEVEPFGRYTTGNEEMEKAAFHLKPGEVSHLIGTPDGYVMVKCVKRIPPQADKKLEDVRAQLVADCSARKLNQVEIPALARELREQAHPKIFIKKETSEELLREVRKEIAEAKPKAEQQANP